MPLDQGGRNDRQRDVENAKLVKVPISPVEGLVALAAEFCLNGPIFPAPALRADFLPGGVAAHRNNNSKT